MLWSGVAYRDFALWRERYPGGLTATEEAFAEAATRRAGRRRRVRRLAVATLVAAVAIVAVTMGVLWRSSEIARQHATAESLRAEAGMLQVIGERELASYPTASLAYAIKSLELADTPSARLLALRVVQQAPVARIARISQGYERRNWAMGVDFSPTGDWVGWGGDELVELLHRSGERRLMLKGYAPRGGVAIMPVFSTDGRLLIGDRNGDIRIWSVQDGKELHRARVLDEKDIPFFVGASTPVAADDRFLTLTSVRGQWQLHDWPLPVAPPMLLGSLDSRVTLTALTRSHIAYAQGRGVYLRSIRDWKAPARLLFEQPTEVTDLTMAADATQVATYDPAGTIRVARTDARPGGVRVLASSAGVVGLWPDRAGRWLFGLAFEQGHPTVKLYHSTAPSRAEPLLLQKGDTTNGAVFAMDPAGNWLATSHGNEVAFWPVSGPRARIFRQPFSAQSVQFTVDGRWLLWLGADRSVRMLPLSTDEQPRTLFDPGAMTPIVGTMAVDPSARRVAVTGGGGRVSLVNVDGGSGQSLQGFPAQSFVGRPAFSHDGRMLAAGMEGGRRDDKVIRVWDLGTGTSRMYGPFPGAGDRLQGGIIDVAFAGPDRLLAAIQGTGLVSVELDTGATRVIVPSPLGRFALSADGRWGVAVKRDRPEAEQRRGRAVRFDVVRGTTEDLDHGTDVSAIALDARGSLVATGGTDGTIRVSPVSGGPPHLLLGAEGAIYSLAFSRDSRWLAACGEAFAIRIWPVPDVSKPPPHLLPRDALLTWLRSHTNLRAVPNAASATGYVLEPGPFPGWADVPAW